MLCEPWCDMNDVLGLDGSAGNDCAACGTIDDAPSDSAIAKGITLASSILFNKTGKKFRGLCDATVRPCARYRGSGEPLPAWRGVASNSPNWWSWDRSWGAWGIGWSQIGTGCDCLDECQCGGNRQVGLGRYPVKEIVSVTVDGALVDPGAYHVDAERLLVRDDGLGWPWTQNVHLPATDVGTFEVDFKWGRQAPAAGRIVAAIYSCELARGMCGLDCNLPSRATSIVRQGVTVQLQSAAALLTRGLTGITAVDQWVDAFNNGRKPRAPLGIASPDIGRETYDSRG